MTVKVYKFGHAGAFSIIKILKTQGKTAATQRFYRLFLSTNIFSDVFTRILLSGAFPIL